MEASHEPADTSTDSTGVAVTRRRALLGVGGVAASTLAGCLGSGASGSSKASIDANLPCFESSGAKSVDQPLPSPVEGDPNASVVVAAYEDFACSHCQRYNLDILPEIESKYIEPGTIRYEHHDMPVVSELSWTAASAARAVQVRAGDEAFWVYAEQLYKNQDFLGPDLYASIADAICLDGEAVRKAAMNQKYRETVTANRKQGIEMGVGGTPTIFVNGNELSSYSFDAISSAIESAL
jgi:protein-disulfide isomerase